MLAQGVHIRKAAVLVQLEAKAAVALVVRAACAAGAVVRLLQSVHRQLPLKGLRRLGQGDGGVRVDLQGGGGKRGERRMSEGAQKTPDISCIGWNRLQATQNCNAGRRASPSDRPQCKSRQCKRKQCTSTAGLQRRPGCAPRAAPTGERAQRGWWRQSPRHRLE